MSGAGVLQLFARYHVAVTRRVVVGVPSAEIARRPVAVGFGTILGTMNHIAAVDELWLSRIREGGSSKYDYIYNNDSATSGKSDDELWFDLTNGSWEETCKLADANARALEQYTESLTSDAQLASWFNYRTTSGESASQQVGPALLHTFNHATDHRGQIHSALACLGIDGAVVDMPAVLGQDLRL